MELFSKQYARRVLKILTGHPKRNRQTASETNLTISNTDPKTIYEGR